MITKKPKNLVFKIELCGELKKKLKPVELSYNGYGFTYYIARYIINDLDITVYFQRYVRNVFRVDFVKIYHSKLLKNLSKNELVKLKEMLK